MYWSLFSIGDLLNLSGSHYIARTLDTRKSCVSMRVDFVPHPFMILRSIAAITTGTQASVTVLRQRESSV